VLKHALVVRGAKGQQDRLCDLKHGLDEGGDDDEQDDAHDGRTVWHLQINEASLQGQQYHGQALRPTAVSQVIVDEGVVPLQVELGGRQQEVREVRDGHRGAGQADEGATDVARAL